VVWAEGIGPRDEASHHDAGGSAGGLDGDGRSHGRVQAGSRAASPSVNGSGRASCSGRARRTSWRYAWLRWWWIPRHRRMSS
jgi:hypothetical protein